MPPSKNISFDELSKYFHLPINQVAKELGICATILKKICRRNGIPRWPHRKIKSLDKMIGNLNVNLAKNPQEKEEIFKEMEALKIKRSEIMKHPDILVSKNQSASGAVRHNRPKVQRNSPYQKYDLDDEKDSDDEDDDDDLEATSVAALTHFVPSKTTSESNTNKPELITMSTLNSRQEFNPYHELPTEPRTTQISTTQISRQIPRVATTDISQALENSMFFFELATVPSQPVRTSFTPESLGFSFSIPPPYQYELPPFKYSSNANQPSQNSGPLPCLESDFSFSSLQPSINETGFAGVPQWFSSEKNRLLARNQL
mmetsp:Transcript_2613/g.3472  ORF Transcript_2613/g.3472 Transcript_2613/m.3472 type:complete len:316 (-) Transcript_2613:118-1065(-)|eukprot:CAMPEP_0168560184 /NCGR_PEP_ID=MMETSP0413-20121227/10923_1 /TAXON_ID=136452 /ORGANISM="Filamoeba nolandi, Strain NC-AS-23-1" /LENGTH=315 /DNA_ID=CAMNT_0008591465 /DNA_START=171 /DNA_END=1118 /DNA_ORIENTATION=+